jgi:hypothetical protein
MQRPPPVLPELRQHDPEDPVRGPQLWPRLAYLPERELLPKCEVLQRQLPVRASRGTQCPNKDPKPSHHDRPIEDPAANRKTIASDEFSERTGGWLRETSSCLAIVTLTIVIQKRLKCVMAFGRPILRSWWVTRRGTVSSFARRSRRLGEIGLEQLEQDLVRPDCRGRIRSRALYSFGGCKLDVTIATGSALDTCSPLSTRQ